MGVDKCPGDADGTPEQRTSTSLRQVPKHTNTHTVETPGELVPAPHQAASVVVEGDLTAWGCDISPDDQNTQPGWRAADLRPLV